MEGKKDMKLKSGMNITVPLQLLLIKRWVNDSWYFQKLNEILSITFNKYKNQFVDNIYSKTPVINLLKK